ncbi:MAG: hypothetical protein GX948_05895 [Clostridiaceae bacterium]|jgi:hypothetical protein|nr:hypothetical protein [Clostridia bacterium]MBP6162317.1 hypothetical protein [Clostridia bacterium]MBP6949583.1 hypothetical protein [Clostridia bacterium]NMA36365.1 hypothetical protein [Clostridiaceae bacterium]
MEILDLTLSLEKGRRSRGLVLISNMPDIRSGRRDDFMSGFFYLKGQNYLFRIWDKDVFEIVNEFGPGIYIAELVGADYNGPYLTVKSIDVYSGTEVTRDDFLDGIPRNELERKLATVRAGLDRLGATETCWELVEHALADPRLEDRFMVEGAAIRHHDNVFGGLANHTIKMLNILKALLENNPPLQASADLLVFSIFMHDIGKVFEYRDLDVGEFWYANHRVRGIEFLAALKDTIIERYDESFYRQVQSVIAGHHGLYGDRPTTVAATIIHYIDMLESQTTEIIREQNNTPGNRIRHPDFGFLYDIPLAEKE